VPGEAIRAAVAPAAPALRMKIDRRRIADAPCGKWHECSCASARAMLVHSVGLRPSSAALQCPRGADRTLQSYEALILIEPDAEEERQEEIVARVREIVLGGGGSWDALDPWGRRKLSYEIEKHTEANHWMVQFSCEPAALAEVDRVLRITDGVLRHKTLRRKPAA